MPENRPHYVRDRSLSQPRSSESSFTRSQTATRESEHGPALKKTNTPLSYFLPFSQTSATAEAGFGTSTQPSLPLTPPTPDHQTPETYPILLSPKESAVERRPRAAQQASSSSPRPTTSMSSSSIPQASAPARMSNNASDKSADTPKCASIRPTLNRAASTTAAVAKPSTSTQYGTNSNSTMSRPTLIRAVTTALPVTTPTSATPLLQKPAPSKRPSYLRRVTSAAIESLELNANTSLTLRNAPPEPTYWLDRVHRQTLLATWDKVHAEAASAQPPRSTTAQVVSVKQQMLKLFPVLWDGELPLSGDWIEYVLGVALRAPFSSGAKMGRWEILASNSAGARMNWGPW